MHPPARGRLLSDLTSFVGRQEELRSAAALLSRSRLLTLTGPGGVGKTRLARMLARRLVPRFPGGVCYVELADLNDPDLLSDTVAAALDLSEDLLSTLQQITERIGTSEFLLVLDNCEHLARACAELVTTILSDCPDLRIIATSQHLLHVAGEQVLRVPPMGSAADGPTEDAVALFVERAQAVNPWFTLTPDNQAIITDICRRLDCLPLAIELAAARMRHLSASALRDHLDEIAPMASEDHTRPPRHRTIGSSIRWSYDLCSRLEQALVAQIAVFSGHFDLEAAQAVLRVPPDTPGTVVDGLFGLVDKSIVIRVSSPETSQTRYRVLEPLREFGAALLDESGLSEAVLLRHRDHYLSLATRGDTDYCTPQEMSWFHDVDQDLANLRLALRTSLDTPEQHAVAARMALSLRPYWTHYGRMREGLSYLREAIASESLAPSIRLRALATVAKFAALTGSTDVAAACLADHRATAQGSEAARWCGADTEAQSYLAFVKGDLEAALSLARRASDEALDAGETAVGLEATTWAALLALATRHDGAEELAHRLHTFADEHKAPWFRAAALWLDGMNLWLRGNDLGATERFRVGLADADHSQRMGITAGCVDGSALVAARAGDHRRSARLMGAADALWRRAELWLPLSSAAEIRRQVVSSVVSNLSRREYEEEFAAGAAMSMDEAVQEALQVRGTPPNRPGPLTRREQEIAELVSDGLTSREIAARLVVSPRTVETHVNHIMTKLGLRSRAQIATWWTKHSA